jgi:FAD/FMN-containing dehydrogenase
MSEDRTTRRSFLAATALGAGALAAATPTATLASAAAAAAAGLGHAPSAAQWAALRRSLAGTLVLPADAAYPQAKLVYDLRFEGARPAAVAYPRSSGDVQRLLDFARGHGLAPIPRCGGHSYAGYSTGGGLVIDVANLGGVSVSGSHATVGAGTRLIDMYSALAQRGVLVPGGSCPTVGISGLTLGGGIGVLGRKYGLTADALRQLTVVTADASALTANPGSHSDLYWASRGGGGRNFGIVTSLQFNARPLPALAMFTMNFPWPAAGDLLGSWLEWIRGAPDELWSNCLLLSAGSSGLIARTTGVYVGSTSALATLLAKLRSAVGTAPSSSSLSSATYLQAMLIEAGCAEITLAQCHLQAPGSAGTLARTAFLAKSAYFARAPPSAGIAAVVDAISSFQRELPSLGGGLAFDSYGGAINAVAPGATAFVHRDALCQLQMTASLGPATPQSTVRSAQAWLESSAKSLERYTNGQAYQNYIDPTLQNWLEAYYGSNLPRLRAVKARYDPDNVFRFAQSIPLPA